MSIIRKIIDSDKLKEIIDLPEEFAHKDVEILVISTDIAKQTDNQDFRPEDFEGVLNLQNAERDFKNLRMEWERF
jgi:hypothetical protein